MRRWVLRKRNRHPWDLISTLKNVLVSSQPVLRLTSGVSPYHSQTSGSKSLHRPQRESRGKDRLSVGAFTISRSHAVSRGARVGSPAAEIIATFVCTSSRCVCARFCASEPVRSDQEQAQAVAPVPGRALCVSWRTSADYSNQSRLPCCLPTLALSSASAIASPPKQDAP